MSPRPRFIAGAVCPACGALDRTVLAGDGAARERRCVACGFRETVRDERAPVPAGRFESRGADADDGEARPVRIVARDASTRPRAQPGPTTAEPIE